MEGRVDSRLVLSIISARRCVLSASLGGEEEGAEILSTGDEGGEG